MQGASSKHCFDFSLYGREHSAEKFSLSMLSRLAAHSWHALRKAVLSKGSNIAYVCARSKADVDLP